MFGQSIPWTLLPPWARFSGPVIGAINGVAITGGFELALACDVLLASTEARFADTHGASRSHAGLGTVTTPQPCHRHQPRQGIVIETGNFLGAQQACDWGLVNRVVAPEDLMPQARALRKG